MRLLVVGCVLAASVLPGCLWEPEWADPQISFSIRGITATSDGCQVSGPRFDDKAADPHCHTVRASVTNGNEKEDFSFDESDWTAVTKTGGVFHAVGFRPSSDLAAGYTNDVNILFEVDGPAKIDVVRLEDIHHDQPVKVKAPAY